MEKFKFFARLGFLDEWLWYLSSKTNRIDKAMKNTSTHFFLQFSLGKESQLVAKDFLRIEHLLVVHFFDKGVVLDTIRLEKLDIGDLKSLADRLGNELCLQYKYRE